MKLNGGLVSRGTSEYVKQLKARDMKRAEYLNTIKEIGKALREQGLSYARIFSDKRKTTGYRTKIWFVGNNAEVIAAIARRIGGDSINVTIAPCSAYGGNRGNDVIITPKQLI